MKKVATKTKMVAAPVAKAVKAKAKTKKGKM